MIDKIHHFAVGACCLVTILPTGATVTAVAVLSAVTVHALWLIIDAQFTPRR